MDKHAFLIIAHNEPKVLKTLLRLLDYPQNDIFIHIDKRSVSLRKEIEALHLTYSNLHILPKSICVYWGDISQLKVEFSLFETAWSYGPYLYYHLISGVDLPIKSQQEIHRFFEEHKGKEFLGFWLDRSHEKDLDRKLRRYYLFTKYMKGGSPLKHNSCAFIRNAVLSLQKVSFYRRKHQILFKKGYQWVSVTQPFVEYLLKQKDEILRIFKYTLCPDEIFIQTILWNSPFKDSIYSLEDASKGSVRYIDWTRGNPYVWKEDDIDELLNSPYLFARKFSERHIGAVEKIESRLLQREDV